MVASVPKPPEPIDPLRKSAILMVLLGEQSSAELMRALDEAEVQRLSEEMARLRRIPPETANSVVQEFHQMQIARAYAVQGGLDYAEKVLTKAFGNDAARKLLDGLARSLRSQPQDFEAIQKADPQQLAKFINEEHPQTIAVVLSHLLPPQAAALLACLPADLRSDVALRMASLDQISPEIVERVAGQIGQKLKNLGEYRRESCGGIRAVAEICNRLDSATSKHIIDNIERQNSGLAESIRQLMFVFEDILLIDEAGMRELVSRADRKLLTMALKGTSDRMKEHFTKSMSQRAIEMLREDMEALGPVKLKNVDAAQQQIIALARQLEQDGVLTVRASARDEYVV